MVSTAVLALAMAAARFLPLTARTRSVVLLCGILKFAVPTAVFRFVPAQAFPEPLRFLGGGSDAVAQAATRIDWIPILWGAVAFVLIARWLLLRSRTISAALRSPTVPSTRELAAVRDARMTLGIRNAIDTIRSPICEAPAVLRIIRPVIVLPANGCDHLTGDELRSLVLHESAHVARHDNLAAFVQALATSLLWFHPLVWLASHALTIAREEACDEAVADSMSDTGAYVSALTKICHGIAAPRTAGASCMASAKIKERMEHLMSYETLKRKAWSHRATIAVGIVLIAISTLAATAAPQPEPRDHGTQEEENFDGEPISITLKAADLRDVMATFAQLTGLTFKIEEGVEASITMSVVDVPWDKALHDMLNAHGLVARVDGQTVHVSKKKD